MRWFVFLSLLLSLRCGGIPPDYVSTRGVSVWLASNRDFLSVERSDELESHFVAKWTETHSDYRLTRCLAGTEVHVRDAQWPCDQFGVCAGKQQGSELTIAENHTEYYWSPYRHELLHWIFECTGVVSDGDHYHRRAEWAWANNWP